MTAIARASDGFQLPYISEGAGPVLVFPSRAFVEHEGVARLLSYRYQVVRYLPRGWSQETLDPDAATRTRWPTELMAGDLDCVLDAAEVTRGAILWGYSGTGAFAARMAPESDRVSGLVCGGFPLFAGYDDWAAYLADQLRAMDRPPSEDGSLGPLLYQDLPTWDDRTSLARLPGPKVIYAGSLDGAVGGALFDAFPFARTADKILEQEAALVAAGFSVKVFQGFDHVELHMRPEIVAPWVDSAISAQLGRRRSP